jgi:hypothetical protein
VFIEVSNQTPINYERNEPTTTLQHSAVITSNTGHAIAQVVSHWLPTAVAWVQIRVKSSGICGGQSGAGAGSFIHSFIH